MASFPQRAAMLAKELNHAFLETKDYNKVVSMFDPEFTWLGRNHDRIMKLHETETFLYREVKRDERYLIIGETYEPILLDVNLCLVAGKVQLQGSRNFYKQLDKFIRFTYIFKQYGDKFTVLHMSCPLPSFEEEPTVYPTDRLDIEEGRYRYALEAMNDIVFELDIVNQTVEIDPERFFHLFQVYPQDKFKKGYLFDIKNVVHPDDQNRVMNSVGPGAIMPPAGLNKDIISLEYRIRNKEQGYIWVDATMVPLVDRNGEVVRIIGAIKNINQKKQAEIAMRRLSENDSLTGLYNNKSTEKLIAGYLMNSGIHCRGALLIIDIDDFKSINDNYGHQFGDSVLAGISIKIRKLFRTSDIIGRIGGDEFMIFIKDVDSYDLIQDKAAAICKVFREYSDETHSEVKILCSIGIALYPHHGLSYKELYVNADRALYEAKNQGKNRFCFYKNDIYQNSEYLKHR